MRLATAILGCVLTVSVVPRVAGADPHNDYMLHCQGCHGPDGRGAPGGVPSFRGQLAKFLSVPGGREYLMRVPGTSQSELSDARVAAVLNWMVRAFNADALPMPFDPFTEDEVTRNRRPPLVDVVTVRANLQREIDAHEPAASTTVCPVSKSGNGGDVRGGSASHRSWYDLEWR